MCRKQLGIFVEKYDKVPYEVLNYLGAIVNYGGRVTDDKDSLLISTILKTFICEEAIQPGHAFSKSGLYKVIEPGDKEDYIEYIKKLPLNPQPEAFGLHENAEITTYINETLVLMANVLAMQPKSGGGGKGKSREEVIGDQAKSVQSRAPPVFSLEKVSKMYPTSYEESMNTVLFQECVRYNKLLAEMASSLKQVQKALVGDIGMTDELEKMADAIYNNQVPPMWAKKGFLSLKPLASWIEDCNKRIDFLNEWIAGGTPIVYWVSGFFFPQAFFTGNLQNYARGNTIAVDKISFGFRFLDDKKPEDFDARPEKGCLTYGLYLEGCKWSYETHMLAESDPKKLFVELPLLHFVPEAERARPDRGIYFMPVYKVLSRTGTLSTTGHSTNFVMKLEVPTDIDPGVWIKAGVAGFLALRY